MAYRVSNLFFTVLSLCIKEIDKKMKDGLTFNFTHIYLIKIYDYIINS